MFNIYLRRRRELGINNACVVSKSYRTKGSPRLPLHSFRNSRLWSSPAVPEKRQRELLVGALTLCLFFNLTKSQVKTINLTV